MTLDEHFYSVGFGLLDRWSCITGGWVSGVGWSVVSADGRSGWRVARRSVGALVTSRGRGDVQPLGLGFRNSGGWSTLVPAACYRREGLYLCGGVIGVPLWGGEFDLGGDGWSYSGDGFSASDQVSTDARGDQRVVDDVGRGVTGWGEGRGGWAVTGLDWIDHHHGIRRTDRTSIDTMRGWEDGSEEKDAVRDTSSSAIIRAPTIITSSITS
ncbi:hypothetical protein Tco_0790299 [Tanacetum coccineum]